LALDIRPNRIPKAELASYHRLRVTVYFTNHSKHAIEFMTNGGPCFQYLDISVNDPDNKNHATWKFGDAYIVTFNREKKVIVNPGETTGGTVVLPVDNDIDPGTYRVQAVLTYQGLKVSSNTVQIVIDP
jgi:hypothetical protein